LRKPSGNALSGDVSSTSAIASLLLVVPGGIKNRTSRTRGEKTIELIPEGRIREFLLLMEMALQKRDKSDDDKVFSPLSISRACPRLFWTIVNKFIKDHKEKPKNMEDVLRHIWPE
jgi:hypothetical protein